MDYSNSLFVKENFFEEDGIFEYHFGGSGNLMVRLNPNVDKKSITEVTIPSEYKGYQVTSVGGFSNCQSLEKVVIPDGILFINESAFEGCISLLEVTILGGFHGIHEDAFKDCTNLSNIYVSPTATLNIETHAFFNCKSLKRSIIPKSSIQHEDSHAFENTKFQVRPSEVLLAGTKLTICSIPFIIFIIFIIYGIHLVTGFSFGDSGSSSGSSSGYCQFDGCTRKAVGPTYEFCSYHKKALNAIWDSEYK